MSSFFEFFISLIAWQNMLFTATVGLGAVLFGVQAIGFFGAHDSDHHAELGDADGAGHALDAGHDAGGGHDAAGHALDGHALDGHALDGHALDGHALDGHALDGHALDGHDAAGHALDTHALDAHGGDSFLVQGLRALGVGRIPLSLLLPIALTSFGFSGLFASLAFGGIGREADAFSEGLFFPVFALAVAGSLASIQVAAVAFRWAVPDPLKTASDRLDLLGLVGVVKSGRVDVDFGQVKVTDAFGRALEVPCVALDRERPSAYGEEVVLVDWDPERNRFKVVPFELDGDDAARRLSDGKRRAQALRLPKPS